MNLQTSTSEETLKPTATAKPAQLSEKSNPGPKHGRPVVTKSELEWIKQTAARLGLPATGERDHSIGAQFIYSCGCSMEPIFAVLDARGAERGDGSFKTVGDVFAAEIAHGRYLEAR